VKGRQCKLSGHSQNSMHGMSIWITSNDRFYHYLSLIVLIITSFVLMVLYLTFKEIQQLSKLLIIIWELNQFIMEVKELQVNVMTHY
jgi:hypothetical protein